LRCVRFDLSGLGDSPTRPGRPPRVERAPEAFADIEDAVGQWAGGATGRSVAPAVLVGLCSGGYQALDSGIDLRPEGVVAVNPVLRFPPPESKVGPVDPRRTLCRPVDESLRSMYQRLPDWKVIRLARRSYLAVAHVRSRRKPAAHWLSEMAARGTDVLCICGRVEANELFEGSRKPVGPRVALGERAAIEIVEDLDHGLIPVQHRRQIADLMTDFLVGRYLDGTRPGAVPGTPPHEAATDLVS